MHRQLNNLAAVQDRSASRFEFFNGVRVDFLRDGDDIRGIGQVCIDGVALRSDRRSMFVEIRSPDGRTLCDYRLGSVVESASQVTLDLVASVRASGPMEWMLHTVRNRYNTSDWDAPPQPAEATSLRLVLRPVHRIIGSHCLKGFSYQYLYQSDEIPVYKLLDRSTWEPGGSAVGNEVWMRGGFADAISPIRSIDQRYSTEWYLPGIKNPNIFQFLPLQTQLQGFTFTTGPAGTLMTWPTRVRHIRTLLEKHPKSELILHLHEHCGDLGNELETAPVEVLWLPGELDRVGRVNLYEQFKEHVFDTLHAEAGLRRERVSTHGMIEQWDNANLDDYAARGVPALAKAGVRTMTLANHFQNNMNVFGVGNMCCTVDLKVADSVGEEKLRDLCAEADRHGIDVWMWGNTALSTLSMIQYWHDGKEGRLARLPKTGETAIEIALRAEAGFVRNPSGAVEADHYAPVFAVMNLRDPAIRKLWLDRWKAAHDDIGLRGIFLDSSFNLSSDKFHWQADAHAGRAGGVTPDQSGLHGFGRPEYEPPAAVLSQYMAHLELVNRMQEMGYAYCSEDNGVFGVHRAGPGVKQRLGSLFLWTDTLNNFDVPAILDAGADPDDVFFRGLAFRAMWIIHWDIKTGKLCWNQSSYRGECDSPTSRQLELLGVYNTVEPWLRHRTMLPDETGVVYHDKGRRVLWALKDMEYPLEVEHLVTDLSPGGARGGSRQILARKHHVYLVELNQPGRTNGKMPLYETASDPAGRV
jgi:hypothetical protein